MPDDGSSAPSSKGKVSGFLRKRVLGVPVLYLAVLVVAVLVFYAWRTKASSSAASASGDPNTDPTIDNTDPELLPKPPVGTVIATSGPVTGSNASIETNDDWMRAGVAYLLTTGVGGGVAQVALATYLDGGALTYAQGVLRDKVIAKFGLPPTILPIGVTGPKPVVAPPKPKPVKPPRLSQAKAHPWPGHSIGMGDKGGNVKFIQSRVHAVQSGVFDKWTELHVRQWQARQRLPQDGRIDKVDWQRMFPV